MSTVCSRAKGNSTATGIQAGLVIAGRSLTAGDEQLAHVHLRAALGLVGEMFLVEIEDLVLLDVHLRLVIGRLHHPGERYDVLRPEQQVVEIHTLRWPGDLDFAALGNEPPRRFLGSILTGVVPVCSDGDHRGLGR